MTTQNKLHHFFAAKASRIYAHGGVANYYHEKDAECIFAMDDKYAEDLWNELCVLLIDQSGLNNNSCIPCIQYHFLGSTGCHTACKYAENHGICYDNDSDFRKNLDAISGELGDSDIGVASIFTNEYYMDLIDSINRVMDGEL